MKISAGIYISILIILFSNGCRNDDEEQRLTWSTDAPMTIPYRVRLQRHERENLIRNHSFENGRIFKLDSVTTSFSIDGWQVIGKNVSWTDVRNDSIFSKKDAFSGYRAVRITRKTANETDTQGEGVLSDFIKVIPGNYSLTLYAQLKNVNPLRSRLGTRMFDAVDISIQFYDRNKILMSPAYSYPMAGQIINTSFKGLSFSNFKTIQSFGWGKITGKSNHFPFPEGDIPSNAHFVKIFIGLKGTGTMWVDSVCLKYTSRNFSVAERMQLYTDTTFHTPEVFIPNPKSISRLESLQFFEPGMQQEEYPVILVNKGDGNSMKAALVIQEAFRSCMKGYNRDYPTDLVPIISDAGAAGKSRILFSIGRTSMYVEYENSLPVDEIAGHKDGYFIYSPPDSPKLLILGANDPAGLLYAAYTTVQMIDSKIPVFHSNRIIDYPDFQNRYVTFSDKMQSGTEIYRQLKAYKINGALLFSQEEAAPYGDIPNDGDLFNVISVEGFISPDDSTLTYDYPLDMNAVISNSKGSLIIPPVFHNEMLDNSEYSEICCQVTVDTRPLYSGSSFFSLNTDAADIMRYSSVMGQDPVFLDNSMLIHTDWGRFAGSEHYYPGKLRLFNIFEPYINTDIKEFFPYLDTTLYVVNLPPTSEVNLIRLATAADFMWNSNSYSYDFALWKVLMTRYGAENARDLISFADKYAFMLETLGRINQSIQVPRNYRVAQQTLVELTSLVALLRERLGHQSMLVKELQEINSGLRTKLGYAQPPVRN